MAQVKWRYNKFRFQDVSKNVLEKFTLKTLKEAVHFHSSLPDYQATPLHNLESLAESLGVKSIYIKDEAKRFNTKAFKALGGS